MKKFLKAAKLTGIAFTASFAIIAVIYLLETKAVAGGAQYEAVTAEYTSAAAHTESAAISEQEQTEKATTQAPSTEGTTVKATQPETTEVQTVKKAEEPKETVTPVTTEAATQTPVVVPATEAATQTPVVVSATEAATEAPTEAPTTAAVKAQTPAKAQAPAKAQTSAFTNVTYKDGNGTSHSYATLDEAKAAIKVQVLSDAQAKTAAKNNKTTYSTQAGQVVELINAYRTANGLKALTYNDTLATAAMHRAAESAYSDWNMTAMENGAKRHIRPNYKKASTIADEYGISGNFGENFGRWQASPEEIVSNWKASSSHNALLLGTEYTKIGVGVAQDSLGDYYWIAIFN